MNRENCSEPRFAWSNSFSPDQEIVNAGEDAKTMRLGDAIAAVGNEIPAATIHGKTCVGFENFSECKTWKFGHLLCWIVA